MKHVNNQENEFYCNTCQTNMKLDRVIEFEKTSKDGYIPLRIRRTKKIGTIFTRNSIMYNWHIQHGLHHAWGNVAEAEEMVQLSKIGSSMNLLFSF